MKNAFRTSGAEIYIQNRIAVIFISCVIYNGVNHMVVGVPGGINFMECCQTHIVYYTRELMIILTGW